MKKQAHAWFAKRRAETARRLGAVAELGGPLDENKTPDAKVAIRVVDDVDWAGLAASFNALQKNAESVQALIKEFRTAERIGVRDVEPADFARWAEILEQAMEKKP